jgi:crotonobetainyl-CoA:carnitine CoA-transferase CaiB-like acyl-CoA transferase
VTAAKNGALAGVTVLDLSRVLAGPYCTQLLGDYGAEVIKIEQPGQGDGTRQWGPPWIGAASDGLSAYYASVNRNKRSVAVNLKHEQGWQIIRTLAERADVLIENFLPGTLDALDLGYAALHALNPKLVFCAITGYGQTGPYRNRPGYDFAIQAEGGLMSITGPADGEPYKAGVAIADITTGLFAATAILAALHHREHSGVGQYIDVALLDTQVAWLANVAQNALAGAPVSRWGNAHPSIVPYQAFATRDGHLALAVGTDRQFAALCAVLGCAELSSDVRFRDNPNRVAHRTILIDTLSQHLLRETTHYWLAALHAVDVPCAPINSVEEALRDPQIRAREMVQRVVHPAHGALDLLGPVAKFSGTPARIYRAPPDLGADTQDVLREFGYDTAELATLRDIGAIGGPAVG